MALIDDDPRDDEMIGIFVEEAQEILDGMDRDFVAWKQHPTDKEALTGLRRAFHTLKGSGRMVEAVDLGELAWKIENMLNQALEGAIPVTERMVELVAASRMTMPKLVEAFKHRRQPEMGRELASLMSEADLIASGTAPAAPAVPPAPVAKAEPPGTQVKLDDLQKAMDRSVARANEALKNSETALQQVRRLASQVDAIKAPDGVSRTELAPLFERVNVLSREVAELRLASKRSQQEEAPNPRELLQSVDQRIREKLAPTERARADVMRELEASRHAAISARRLAIASLLISLTILGAAAAAVLLNTA
jgi:chemosensory pili system protein ChpA (sensor histidine kinase/response regulator)